jgi:hypothetical protein
MACFQGLEDEADTMCDEIQFGNEDQYIDDIWHTRERHLKINYAMRQELLNNACVWIFHLFEKECKTIFKTDKKEEKENHLKKLAISTDKDSSWWKLNRELRLVANTIKHGEGKSCDDLKKIRPDIFNTKPLFFSSSLVKISSMDLNKYSEIMFYFWSDYFKSPSGGTRIKSGALTTKKQL